MKIGYHCFRWNFISSLMLVMGIIFMEAMKF